MFTGKIEGIRLLKTGEASVMLTCSGEQLQAIAELRIGNITVYGEDEKPLMERAATLARIRNLAEQVAEAIDRELNGVDEDTEGLMTAMEFDKESGK